MSQKKSKEYWEKRQVDLEKVSFDKGTEAYKEYRNNLIQSKKEIDDKIAKLYGKYQTNTGLSKAAATKMLKGAEFREWRKSIGGYVNDLKKITDKNSLEYKKLSLEIETLAYRSRISRLDSLKADIKMELIRSANKNNKLITSTLTSVYGNNYKSVTTDLGVKATIDFERVKKTLAYDWSGKNYSKRIWTNTDKLAETIKSEVVKGMNQGINYKTMSKRIVKNFDVNIKNAERLVRTEINYIHNQGTLDGYKDAGVKKYQFSATLDSRTSNTCASLNGEIFKTDDVVVGINYPPMHVNCRSTTTPIIDFSENVVEIKVPAPKKEVEQVVEKTVKSGTIKEENTIVKNTELTLEERAVIMKYKSSESFKINEKLRNSLELTEDDKIFIKNLDAALEKLPTYEGEINRTIELKGENLSKFLYQHEPETIKEYLTYTSFSTNQVFNPNGNVIIESKSTNAVNLKRFGLDEDEVLYKRNSKFKVVSAELREDNKFYLTLEEVNE